MQGDTNDLVFEPAYFRDANPATNDTMSGSSEIMEAILSGFTEVSRRRSQSYSRKAHN